MANQDRWRDRDDWYRDEDRGQEFGRGSFGGGRDYRGEYRGDWERGGTSGYGRGREFEGGYGGSEYGRGRDFGGGSAGYGGGGFAGYGGGFESGYRGGGAGGYGSRDFERGSPRGGGYGSSFGGGDFERGYRGGGGFGSSGSYGSGFGQGEWDRAYGAGGYAGLRGRGSDWGFGSGSQDYGRWDWTRGSDYGGGDYGRSGYGGQERGFWDRASDEVSSWFGDEEAERRRRIDHHRGRGPKGYTRSDDRIREDVNDRLTDDWRVDASNIDVSVSTGEVTLSGTVDSRDAKRRAEDLAENISGVKHVQNNLRVRERTWGGASTGTTGVTRSETGTASTTGGPGTNVSQSAGTRARRSGT
jgi:osmotically-inducible protein OsmY